MATTPARGDTREEILRTASRLLQTRGYTAFSYGQIAETLGIKPAAVHYHFPSKTDLGVALVGRFRARYQMWMEDAEHLPPLEQLDGFIALNERFVKDGSRICPAGVLQAEYYAVPEEVQQAVKGMIEEIQTWLTGLLEDGKKKGQLDFDGVAADQAALLYSSITGALQFVRSLGPDHFYSVVRQLKRNLEPKKTGKRG
jgi:TetR/AcrR family transcriptional regulator, transcriptional repressor for nem operon